MTCRAPSTLHTHANTRAGDAPVGGGQLAPKAKGVRHGCGATRHIYRAAISVAHHAGAPHRGAHGVHVVALRKRAHQELIKPYQQRRRQVRKEHATAHHLHMECLCVRRVHVRCFTTIVGRRVNAPPGSRPQCTSAPALFWARRALRW